MNSNIDVINNVTANIEDKNVTLNLNNHTLAAKGDGDTLAIDVGKKGSVTVKNGSIIGNLHDGRALVISSGLTDYNNTLKESTAVLTNLIIENYSYTTGSGIEGILEIGVGNTTITDCKFTNNLGPVLHINGVTGCYNNKYGNGGEATVSRSYFEDNKEGEKSSYTVRVGVSTTFDDCEFSGNTADCALYASQSKLEVNVKIQNSKFKNNKGSRAGAIINNNATMNITGTTVESNSSTGDVGAILNDNGTLTLENTVVKNNSAETELDDIDQSNATGGIKTTKSTLKVNSGAFYNNTAGGKPSDICSAKWVDYVLPASDMVDDEVSFMDYQWVNISQWTAGMYANEITSNQWTGSDGMNIYANCSRIPKGNMEIQCVVRGSDYAASKFKYTFRVNRTDYDKIFDSVPNGETEILEDLTPGEYKIINLTDPKIANVENYDRTVTIESNGEVSENGIVVVEDGKTIQVKIVYTYTPKTGTLTLTNKVEGATEAAAGKEFSYTIKAKNESNSYPLKVNANGRETLDLPAGSYELTADDANVNNYRVNTQITGGSSFSISADSNKEIIVIHTYEKIEAVAKSGEKTYESLEEAVNDDTNNGKIEILKSIDIIEPIHVTRAVTLTSAADGDPVILTRSTGLVDTSTASENTDNESKDNMFVVDEGGELTLNNIILDSGKNDGLRPKRAIVKVNGDGALELGDKAVLRNNELAYNKEWASNLGGYFCADDEEDVNDSPYNGGGVFVDGGTLTMNSGSVIQGCKAHNGGGVLVQFGTFIMNEGAVIQNNTAYFVDGQTVHDGKTYYDFNVGAGGGVLIAGKGVMEFKGGTIQNNSAGFGGGIAAGTDLGRKDMIDEEYGDQLMMSGSNCLVTANEAEANGGGIFVGWGTIANVQAGKITDNKCATDPNSYTTAGHSALYGGGGIYVQGDDTYSGKLKISGVKITGNNAALNGGGVAGCPYSEVAVYFDSSGVIYGNNDGTIPDKKLENPQEEIYITPHNFEGVGRPTVRFSPFMAGGGEYNWTDKDGNRVRYELLDLTLNEGDSAVSLYNTLTAESDGVEKAENMGILTVEISGNISYAGGGGIGTNGTVEVGTENKKLEETIDLSVRKIWNDSGNENRRPGSITFTLYQDDVAIEQYVMTSDEDGTWPADAVEAFKSLPRYDLSDYTGAADYEPTKEYKYEIREEAVNYYTSSAENADGVWTFTNTYRPTTPPPTPSTPTTSVTVNKLWAGDEEANVRPASIQVQLYRGEATYGAPVTLSAPGWTYTWSGLPVGTDYRVEEVNVPEGYNSLVEQNGNTFTITNTWNEPAPRSGVLSVEKVWEGDDEETRPAEIQVQLYKDGEADGDRVTLSAENEWSYGWTGLDSEADYTVAEVEVPDGYTASVTHDGTAYIITNTYSEEITEPETPKAETPDTPDETKTPDEPQKTVVRTITDSSVPLASAPTEEIEEIEETAVPLGDAPKTGDDSPVAAWTLVMMASLLGVAAIHAYLNRKRREQHRN